MKKYFYEIRILSKYLLYYFFVGMYEEPLQKVESMIEDHAEHFKSTVVQKYPTAKIF